MDVTGGRLVARTLKQAGVGHVFTLCGGHILPIYDGCVSEGLQVVDMRHEQACAHAGDAYARLTRNIGVAVVTAGPGVTDAVTGVANAYSARSPLLLIGGAAPLGLRGLGALQETEQVALLRPITKGSWTVAETRQIPEVLTTAIRAPLTRRPRAVGWAVAAADLVLVLGAPLDFRLGYGRPPTFAEDARVVMVDCDPAELGRNRPLELGLHGHIGRVLDQLVETLPAGLPARFEEWRRRVGQKERGGRGTLDAESASGANPRSHYR